MEKKLPLFSFDEKIILLIAFLASATASVISFSSGKILLYNDALAHLNTARRIVDSLTPGLVQIGSVWLPLLHLLELPFVVNYHLWQTGLAGTIISSLCFIFATLFLFKLLFLTTQNRMASYVGSIVFIFNTNLLYLQTSAMFEPLLLFTFLGSVYFLTKWAKYRMLNDLLLSSFFALLATLTRYDGWALCILESFCVLLYAIKKKNEGKFLLFIFMAFFGIFLWFLYNKLIFSDALYFMHGEYSAFVQQKELLSKGQLLTKNNLFLSFLTYSLISGFAIGVLTSITFILGTIYYLVHERVNFARLIPLLLFTPFLFNIFSLFNGQSVIWMPQLPPYFDTYFNARYGVLMLPAAAFFIGYLASAHRISLISISAVVLVQISLFLGISKIPGFPYLSGTIILKDATSSLDKDTLSASTQMKNMYKKGLILVSSASCDAFIFRTGIPLQHFITEGTGSYWRDSLKNPDLNAQYIVHFADKSDRVGKVLGDSSSLLNRYHLVYQNDKYFIWQKKM